MLGVVAGLPTLEIEQLKKEIDKLTGANDLKAIEIERLAAANDKLAAVLEGAKRELAVERRARQIAEEKLALLAKEKEHPKAHATAAKRRK